MNIKATAKQIMSAMQSDAFTQEACEQILRDARIDEQPRIYTRCPACFNDTLTINKGHLLCTWLDCPNPALIDSAEPACAAQPKATDDQQEWTCKDGVVYFDTHKGWPLRYKKHALEVVNAHKSALAAERQRTKRAQSDYGDACLQLQTERQRLDVADRDRCRMSEQICELHEQRLSALAAIEKHNKSLEGSAAERHIDPINVDLSALREHDEKITADVRKPLVEALKQARAHSKSFYTVREICDDALAKVRS
jgi:hypothetical protein